MCIQDNVGRVAVSRAVTSARCCLKRVWSGRNVVGGEQAPVSQLRTRGNVWRGDMETVTAET